MESGKLKEENENNSQLDKQTVLSQLPKGWEIKKLGEVCEILDKLRKPITKRDRIAGKYPYYGATGILDYINDFIFDERLVLVGEDGAKWNTGDKSAFIAEGKYWVNNHAHVIRPQRQILLDKWLVNYLNFSDLSDYVSGMTVPKLNQGSLKQIQIPIPPLPEQKRIVSILDRAFEAIDQAKANAEQNLKNTKELFQSKMQSIFDNGKLKVESGEWEEKKLGEIFKLKSGDGLTAKNMIEGKYPVFGGNGIAGYHNNFNFENEVIIGRVGALCGNVRYIKEKFWLTDNAFRISEGLNDFNKEFVVYMLNHKSLRNYARQAAQPVISNSSLKDVYISFPKSIKTQKQIVVQLDKLQAETKKLEIVYQKKVEDLEELKKSVLQKAFSGQLIMENE